MKKIRYAIGVIILLLACILPFLRGDKRVSYDTMEFEVNTIVNKDEFKKENRQFARKQYHLESKDYKNIMTYVSTSAMEVDELCVIQQMDPEKRLEIMQNLQEHIDRQLQSFQGYAPRQTALLEQALLFEKGDYVFLIIHREAPNMKENFDALF